jgi:hypothetical protein
MARLRGPFAFCGVVAHANHTGLLLDALAAFLGEHVPA